MDTEYIKNNFTIIVASYTQSELVKAFCRFYRNSNNDKLVNLCIMHDDSWSEEDINFCKQYGTTINAQDVYSQAIPVVQKIKGNNFKNNAVGFISKFKIIEKCPTRYAIWLDDDIELKKSILPIINDYISAGKWVGGVMYKNFVSELSHRNLIFQNALMIIDTYDSRFKELSKYSFEQSKLITDESIFSTYFAGRQNEMADLFKKEYYAVSDLVNSNAITLARNNPDVVIKYLTESDTIMSHWCGGYYGKSEIKKGFIKKSLTIKDTSKLHDVVLVYTKNGLYSQAIKYERYEIEYVIKSLLTFCDEWLNRIFVIGDDPNIEWIKKHIQYIHCDNPYTHIKDANILYKIEKVINEIPDLSDDFLCVSDDQIVTRKTTWEDFTPRYEKDMTSNYEFTINNIIKRKTDSCTINWWRGLSKTFKNTNSHIRWQPHIWSPINKNKFVDMCKDIDYKHDIGCVIFSLYYNYIHQKPVEEFDHVFFRNEKTFNMYGNLKSIPTHISWNDNCYNIKEFRDMLDVIVGFKENIIEPTISSKPVKPQKSKIQQLRDDIQNGRVIRVTTRNGFIWKRIS